MFDEGQYQLKCTNPKTKPSVRTAYCSICSILAEEIVGFSGVCLYQLQYYIINSTIRCLKRVFPVVNHDMHCLQIS